MSIYRSAAIAIAIGALIDAGCSKSPEPSTKAAAEAIRKEWPADFRGYNWGAPLATVLEEESKRSQRQGDRSFKTELAGYPVILSFSYLGDMLAGAKYTFPWPSEAKACSGIMTPGSECSLKSAAYAVEVCGRMGQLLSQKYQVDLKAHGLPNYRELNASVENLDRRLRSRTVGMEMLGRPKAGKRTLVYQAFGDGQTEGQGWRCTLLYRPSPKIEEAIFQRATEKENEAAKADL